MGGTKGGGRIKVGGKPSLRSVFPPFGILFFIDLSAFMLSHSHIIIMRGLAKHHSLTCHIYMQKIFVGAIIECGDNSFERDGQLIETYKVSIARSEDEQQTFHVSLREMPELVEKARAFGLDEKVRITATAAPGTGTKIKWKMTDIEGVL